MATTVEAVDAIQQALEGDGILQSIRAQLRASVFNIISKKSPGKGVAPKVHHYVQHKSGM
jgi:hypothetical protein